LICKSLRTDALIGKRYDPDFLSGNMLVFHLQNHTCASTFTDHHPLLGDVSCSFLIAFAVFIGNVTKCRDAGDSPLFRSRSAAVNGSI
jgi:hypothetical protein